MSLRSTFAALAFVLPALACAQPTPPADADDDLGSRLRRFTDRLLAPVDNPERWLVFSGASHHFRQNERDWREVNPGIGFEQETAIEDLYWVAGYFKNSYDRHAVHGGLRWMPWHLGPLSFGGYALVSTGYPSPALVLPGVGIEYKRVGINFVAAPNIAGYSGYVGVQARIRVD